MRLTLEQEGTSSEAGSPARNQGAAADLHVIPVSFRASHQYVSSSCQIELRRYHWTKPLAQTMHAINGSVVLNMALTSRPEHTRVDRLPAENDPLSGDAGRLLVMLPGMPYRLAAPTGTLRSLYCAISCDKFAAVAGEPIDWSALGPFSGEARAALGIEPQLMRIHDELVRGGLGRDAVLEACIDLICVDLVRRFRRGTPARPDLRAGGVAAWRMRLILKRVHDEGPAPSVSELATLCGLTERQLGRAFKAETGSTIGRFIDEVTMQRAHRLLTTTSLSIAQIATELGYASADSFAQAHRRLTGTPPSRIRQR